MGTGPVVADVCCTWGGGRGAAGRGCCVREVDGPSGAEICRSSEGARGSEEAMGGLISSVNQSRGDKRQEYIHGQSVSAWVPCRRP